MTSSSWTLFKSSVVITPPPLRVGGGVEEISPEWVLKSVSKLSPQFIHWGTEQLLHAQLNNHPAAERHFYEMMIFSFQSFENKPTIPFLILYFSYFHCIRPTQNNNRKIKKLDLSTQTQPKIKATHTTVTLQSQSFKQTRSLCESWCFRWHHLSTLQL